MSKEVERLQELIDQYDNIVFFGGAGVSTESGIPDFRSQDGLYNQKYDYPPETILIQILRYGLNLHLPLTVHSVQIRPVIFFGLSYINEKRSTNYD